MRSFFEPPISYLLATLLVIAGTYAAVHSARLVARGIRDARPLDVIRGIRFSVIALVAGLCAVGVLTANTGFVILGALILAEELYETGVVAAVIRLGDRGAPSSARAEAAGQAARPVSAIPTARP